MKSIGLARRCSLAPELVQLALEDEKVATVLRAQGMHRHSAYFILQAIEKQLRGAMFALERNDQVAAWRANRDHSVEDAAFQLLNIRCLDELTRTHVSNMLDAHVFKFGNLKHLHNDCRYPFYVGAPGGFRMLEIGPEDNEALLQVLEWIKQFVAGLAKL